MIVDQLKKSVNGDMGGKHMMPDGTMMKDSDMEYDDESTSPEYEWVCEQCGSEFCTPTAKEFIRCPLDGTEMKKVSESK